MSVTIPGNELSAGIKSLNTVLEKKDRIKLIGNSNDNKIKEFTATILEIIKGGDEKDIPTKAADVYTKYIKDAMKQETKPAAKKTGKSATKPAAKAATKPAAKKTGKKKTTTTTGKPAAKPAATKEPIERDDFGFSINTKKHEFIVAISKKPMKMSELKAATSDTYYNTVSAHSDRILKTSTNHFYVKGTPAEKLAKEIEVQAKKNACKAATKPAAKKTGKAAAKPAAKKTGKAAVKKTVTKKKITKRTPKKK